MTLVYSVKIASNSPYKIECIDDSHKKFDMKTVDKSKFNALSKNYFKIDTKHDFTAKENVQDNNATITDAVLFYGSRFKELKHMLIKKNDFNRIIEGGTGLPAAGPDPYDDVDVVHIDSNTGVNNPMKFIDFVRNVLNISIPTYIKNVPGGGVEPILDLCPPYSGETLYRNFYQSLTLYDIHDMYRTFPDGRSSISFHIDSATSDDSLKNVPNICKAVENDKSKEFNIYSLELPGSADFRLNTYKQFSFLYFGDLQIADFYYADLRLAQIITANDFQILDCPPPHNAIVNPLLKGFYSKPLGLGGVKTTIKKIPGTPDEILAHNKFVNLCKFSIITMNIFWQTLLSYIHCYLRLAESDTATDFFGPGNSGSVIEGLRHWVFTGISYKDTKPTFNGKFIKVISNTLSVNYIAYWFLKHHHNDIAPNGVYNPAGGGGIHLDACDCINMTKDSDLVEFSVSQKDCANLINKISSTKCGRDKIAIPRPGPNIEPPLCKAILDSFNKENAADPIGTGTKNINNISNKLIIVISQVLKFSGDMSHKTAALMYKNVFSGRYGFNLFTPCVTTTDRPLFSSFFMDDIPGIITSANATILQLSGLIGMGYTIPSINSGGNNLLSFYLPKLEIHIFDFIKSYIEIINDYIKLLNNLYDDTLELFDSTRHMFFVNKRIIVTNIIINQIYQYLTYVSMFYLSLFSSTIQQNYMIKTINPERMTGNLDPLFNDYVNMYKNVPGGAGGGPPVPLQVGPVLDNHNFIGYRVIPVGDTNIPFFYKNAPIVNINFQKTLLNFAPTSVDDLKKLITVSNYPKCFEIPTNIYEPYAGATPSTVAAIIPPIPNPSIINYAWFAYYYSKHQFNEIYFEDNGVPAAAPAAPAAPAAALTPEQTRQANIKKYIEDLFRLYKGVYTNRYKTHSDLSYNANIEREFFKNFELNHHLGGITIPATNFIGGQTAPNPYVLKNFYTKYSYVTGCSYDDSLLKFANLYSKFLRIISNANKYSDLFYDPLAVAPPPAAGPPGPPAAAGPPGPPGPPAAAGPPGPPAAAGPPGPPAAAAAGPGAPPVGPGGVPYLLIDDEFDSLFLYTTFYAEDPSDNKVKITDISKKYPPPPGKTSYVPLFNNIKNVNNGHVVKFGLGTSSLFEINEMVIAKATTGHGYSINGYYLFPFINLSKFFLNTSHFYDKTSGILKDDKRIIKRNDQVRTLSINDVLNNMNAYLTDLNNFFDSMSRAYSDQPDYHTQTKIFCKNGSLAGDCDEIFTGDQCKYVIYFCLLLFNFKCKIANVHNINHVFKKDQRTRLIVSDILPSKNILVPNAGRLGKRSSADMIFYRSTDIFIQIDDYAPAIPINDVTGVPLNTYGDNPRRIPNGIKLPDTRPVNNVQVDARSFISDLYGHTLPPNPPLLPPEPPVDEINVIGIFTDVLDDSEDSQLFDFTKIKGLYCIGNEDALSLYAEIKNGLNIFFENFEKHFDDPNKFYSGIEIL